MPARKTPIRPTQEADNSVEIKPIIPAAQADLQTAGQGSLETVVAETTAFAVNNLEDQLLRLRTRYLRYLFFVIIGWLLLVALVLGLTGYKKHTGFELSDSVLIAFITTTTASVIGLFLGVIRWLYPAETAKAKSQRKK